MQQDFANTLAQASNIQAPTSPLGSFPELANYFKNSFQAPTRASGLSAYSVGNQVAVGNQQAQDAYNRKLQISALSDKAASLDPTDPKNYQQVPKADGGYDFTGPGGQKISVQQYASATGSTPQKVLADSTNALDRQYVNDFSNMQKLINLSVNNDTAGRDKLAKQIGGDNLVKVLKTGNITPDQLIQSFQAYYPHIYGGAPQAFAGSSSGPVYSDSVRAPGNAVLPR